MRHGSPIFNGFCLSKYALQVVNALLTQMDKLKTSPNVIILTTSNINAAIGEPMTYLNINQFSKTSMLA